MLQVSKYLQRWLISCLAIGVLHADPVISEFMAVNDGALFDEDQDTSDWLELFNPTDVIIDLSGYRLTDSPTNRTKWVFPAITLAPGEFHIVFASGKNRLVGELHTNFKLSGKGEYLALLRPDGSPVQAFSPTYPEQFADLSYGLAFTNLVEAFSPVKVHVPADGSLGTNWTGIGFDDASWSNGVTGVGYDGGAVSDLAHQESNLVSYWNFDTQSGGIVPDQAPGSPHAGVLVNGADITSGNQGWNGSGEALNPNADNNVGTRGHLSADDPTSFDFNSSFTWHARVKTAGGSGGILSRSPIASNWNQGSKALFLRNNQVVFDTGWVGNPQTGVQLTDSMWHQVVVTYDSNTDALKIYVDPATANPVPQYNGTHNVNAYDEHNHLHNNGLAETDFRVGWVSPNFDPNEFPGLIDEVAVWTGVFPPEDVALLAQDEPISGSGVFSTLISSEIPVGTLGVYLRQAFSIPGAGVYDALMLEMRFDDGFVASLNGVPIASSNAPPAAVWNSVASQDRDALDALAPVAFPAAADPLRAGSNVLTVHALNAGAAATEMLALPGLVGVDVDATPGYLAVPTPMESNSGNVPPPAGSVTFSSQGATFISSLNVTLSTEVVTHEIRYTTDGSIPDASSTLYAGPMTLTDSTHLRARVIHPGLSPGPVSAGSFVKLSTTSNLSGISAPGVFDSNLPIMVFENFNGGGLNSSSFKPVRVHIFEPDAMTGRASLTHAPVENLRAGFRIRGASSAGFAKKQYRVELWDEDDQDQDVDLLGLASESDWVFGAPYVDEALFRNALVFELGRDIGLEAPRTRFFEAFLNTDGGPLQASDYVGVYMLTEAIKIGDNRVDVPGLDPADITEPDISGGYIIRHEAGASSGPRLAGWNHLEVKDPDDLTATQLSWISDYVDDFSQALHGPQFTDPVLGYRPYIDVGSFVDYMLVAEFVRAQDAYVRSAYLYKERNGPLVNGPLWDYNLSFGISCCFNSHAIAGWQYEHSYNRGERDAYPFDDWYTHLLQDPDFKNAFVDRWHNLRSDVLSTTNFNARVDAFAAELSEAQARNFIKFQTLGSKTTGFQRNEYIFPTWQEHVDHVKDWAALRSTWMDDQSLEVPTFSPDGGPVVHGTVLSMSAGANIYYTTDGSDPRAAGGGIAPGAQLYAAGVPVTETSFFRARASNGTDWSPISTGYLTVGTEAASSNNLVISEFMYHPPETNIQEMASGFADRDVFEFIEVLNIGNQAVDLAGAAFTSGVELVVAPGPFSALAPSGRVVFVENETAFTARYGPAIPIAGRYAKRLGNGGDHLAFTAVDGGVIQAFSYSDLPPWPDCADGFGHSLVLLHPFTNPDHTIAANWSSSTMPLGSPGAASVILSYTNWLAFYFTPEERLNPLMVGPGVDGDGDGVAIAAEYALGMHPRKAELFPPVKSFFTGQGANRSLAISYRELMGLHAHYTVEVSEDLVTWHSGPVYLEEVGAAIEPGDGSRLRVFRDLRTVGDSSLRYIRLRAGP